jgi:superfamily II DNA or RNA helicase
LDAPPTWEVVLSAVMGGQAAATLDAAEVGLQFELVATRPPGMYRGWPEGDTPATSRRIAVRPVLRGGNGWVRTGITWSTLGYTSWRSSEARRHRQLLGEMLALASSGTGSFHYGGYGYQQQSMFLDAFASRRLWDLLAEARDAGLPLVQAGRGAGAVVVGRRPVRMSITADRVDGDLVLTPALMDGDARIAAGCALLIGEPAHGVAWWGLHGEPEPHPKERVLHLAPLNGPIPPGLAVMLDGPAIRVPNHDEPRFVESFYPYLLRLVDVVAKDESVRLPQPGSATLTLTAEPLPGHRLSLRWEWVTAFGERALSESLWATDLDDGRAGVLRQVTDLVIKPTPELLEPSPAGVRLAATATLAGDALIRFLTEVLPRLACIDGARVEAPDEVDLGYREAHEPPLITFAGQDEPERSDWFDLAVRVSVGGEEVAFDTLFAALAQDWEYLILPSGAYFTLERAEFRQLRELIMEARALEDPPPGMLRVGRFQAGLWQDLAELGEITGQASAWQRNVRALVEAGASTRQRVPKSLRAQLRPYQRQGFRWLAALHEHEMGGILADDMGLGKTIQALALMCHARERGTDRGPFLVVAPASVVHNWLAESARFAPHLDVRAVTQTRTRRGVDLAGAVAGADVVVTSYTLFRLEYDDYEGLDWAGLVLDEAQFVKNVRSESYRCAKRLPVAFKVAMTGTPLENNLAELWALCTITAPGLLSRLDRFTEYYRNPIEKGKDTERLAQLRRRVRPLMLRRRKADVVADLPAKQEQIMELELDRRHRHVYQTYLQRERQKVLGLLGDLEKNRFQIFRSLTLLRQASLDVSLVDPKHAAVPSTKLDALVEHVAGLVAEGHRTLVFSQFTRFLHTARRRLEHAGIDCCYLDGKTRNRADVLAEFKTGTAPAFLISLRAGGFGLNLTEADYCILLDPWWNPATEAQAIDRTHRIGQTRNVMVYRLVAKDTIEEKVMALKARKAELFSSVLDDGEFASARLTASDIRALLE